MFVVKALHTLHGASLGLPFTKEKKEVHYPTAPPQKKKILLLGQYFFIYCLTNICNKKLGSEGGIKIKIKINTFSL